MSDQDETELARYLSAALDPDAADALVRCARERGWTVSMPPSPWQGKGYSTARLATVTVADRVRPSQVVLKFVPPREEDSGPEPRERPADPYAAAARSCPESFRAHLVLQAYPPWLDPTGATLSFQALANDDVSSVRSFDELPAAELTESLARVTGDLLASWNSGPRLADQPVSVAAFVRTAVGASLSSRGRLRRDAEAAGLLGDDARWLDIGPDPRTGQRMICPNPVLVAVGTGPSLGADFKPLIGHSHSDLHLRNVLVPRALAAYQLIDLDDYREDGALTADPVCLMLSAVADALPQLAPHDWDEVMVALVRHDDTVGRGPVFDHIAAVVIATTAAVRGWAAGWSQPWERQFALSILASALTFSSYVAFQPKLRWWFFRLAARMAAALVKEPVPPAGAEVRNAFMEPDGDLPDAGPVPLTPAPALDRILARAWSPGTDVEACMRDGCDAIERIGDPAAVVTLLEGLVADCTALLGPYTAVTLELRYRLARWISRSGDEDRAWRLHDDVWRLRERHLGPDHPDSELSFRAVRTHPNWRPRSSAGGSMDSARVSSSS